MHGTQEIINLMQRLYIFEVNGVLIQLTGVDLVVTKVHPTQMTSSHSQCVCGHVLNIHYGVLGGQVLEACLQLSVGLKEPLQSDQQLQSIQSQ